jgi:hypothetical protein
MECVSAGLKKMLKLVKEREIPPATLEYVLERVDLLLREMDESHHCPDRCLSLQLLDQIKAELEHRREE